MISPPWPTPYPEVNTLLADLLGGMREVLGEHLLGFYLEGSLANGGFDAGSDIDFVAVTDAEVTPEQFEALQAMHARLATRDSVWADQLEGSYLSLAALRRYDPALDSHPNLERGPGERLKWVEHGPGWAIHRWVLRERGIPLHGPPSQALIDPLAPDDLRRAMLPLMDGWLVHFLEHPGLLSGRGYQSYVVLSLCRMLYTLETGEIASKPLAAEWAARGPARAYSGLIERAWQGRSSPGLPADAEDVAETLDFIRFVRALRPDFRS